METIKSTQTADLALLAICHSRAFPNSLTSALGKQYLKKMLSWYLSSDKTFIFHIEDEGGKCAGYCGGIISDGTLGTGSASGMAQHTFYQAILAFTTHPWVLFHREVRAKFPLLFKNIMMKLGLKKRVHFSVEQRNAMSKAPHAGLVVIGVNPDRQGKGYGSILLREFERRAVEDFGIKKLQLSVKINNTQAIKAYERNGWMKDTIQGASLSMIKLVH